MVNLLDGNFFICFTDSGKTYQAKDFVVNKEPVSAPLHSLPPSADILYVKEKPNKTIHAIFEMFGGFFDKEYRNVSMNFVIEDSIRHMKAINETGIPIAFGARSLSDVQTDRLYYVFDNQPRLLIVNSQEGFNRLEKLERDITLNLDKVSHDHINAYFSSNECPKFMSLPITPQDVHAEKLKNICSQLDAASIENLLHDDEVLHLIYKGGNIYMAGLSLNGIDRVIGELPGYFTIPRAAYVATVFTSHNRGYVAGYWDYHRLQKEEFDTEKLSQATFNALLDVAAATDEHHRTPFEFSAWAKEFREAGLKPNKKLLLNEAEDLVKFFECHKEEII